MSIATESKNQAKTETLPTVPTSNTNICTAQLEILPPILPSASADVLEVCEQEIFNNDPATWKPTEFFRNYVALHGCNQNKEKDFPGSKREYVVGNKISTRYLHISLFQRKLKNGEKMERAWMIYSESKGSVFCAPCLLFGSDVSFFGKEGFNDWKNAKKRVLEHENSSVHKECVLNLKQRAKIRGRIDHELTLQLEAETSYWRNVLRRVVAVVKSLTSRGLALRGHDEHFGSVHNGNFMMLLEVISQFDPFLGEHIREHGNKGSGSTSYLSKEIYEQLIEVIAEEVRTKIIDELKTAKYYSIIVDSTPDISHVDQLSFCFRFVKSDGKPVERFLTLLSNTGHKGEDMYDAVLATLEKYGVNFDDMRGQAYDNAANMKGSYKGLQGRITAKNPLATYTPCAAHRLNLIGTHAAESCTETAEFFNLIQAVYNFFSESTNRWEILQSVSDLKLSLKSLSTTRWAARADAVLVLSKSLPKIISALSLIQENPAEKAITKSIVKGLLRRLERFETAFMLVVWSTLLSRFNLVSKKLQSISTSLSDVVDIYGSLTEFVSEIRNNDFDLYEERAREISQNTDYELDNQRARKRIVRSDETNEGSVQFVGRDNFKVNTFNAVLDRLVVELRERHIEYKSISGKYKCILQIDSLSEVELRQEARILQKFFPDDLETIFEDELFHFQIHFQSVKGGDKINSPAKILEYIRENNLETVFPNVEIAYRMFCCTAVTNCCAERSFSCLKRVKNYLRATTLQDRLNSLMILAVESELVSSIDFNTIIERFAEKKARRKVLH